MKCPKCGGVRSRVEESRPLVGLTVTRRRRECAVKSCHHRWTTYEVLDSLTVGNALRASGVVPVKGT